ncbi:MAG TPA: 16S rRNA (adenine(1518)-N(6)/adenine(1519)-N(6))-dimethyltransferase RsmA [Polyangiaceae bacterium]
MLLQRHGLRAKKHFGQNFLMDAELATRIAELLTTPERGTVVEIGAGTGALTARLLERAARVIAIERDRDLLPVLRAELADALDSGALELLETDAKSCDWASLLATQPRPHVVGGNLPYQITGPLLRSVGLAAPVLDRVVFLVQLEVADRLVAQPLTDAYGALSVFAQNAFEAQRAFVVRRGAFYPQPGVDSAVVVLVPREAGESPESEEFRALVRAAFAQRRKTLRNAWHGVLSTDATGLERAARDAGIDLSLRGEALSVAAFARMARALTS